MTGKPRVFCYRVDIYEIGVIKEQLAIPQTQVRLERRKEKRVCKCGEKVAWKSQSRL